MPSFPSRRAPVCSLHGPLEILGAIGENSVQDPVDASRSVTENLFERGIILHGSGKDDAGKRIADMVIDLGSYLHAPRQRGAAAGFMGQQEIAERAGDEEGVKVGGKEAVCFVKEDVD